MAINSGSCSDRTRKEMIVADFGVRLVNLVILKTGRSYSE